MTLNWLTTNERLFEGITLINDLGSNKFNLLLSHIIEAKSDEYFTPDELGKLKESLKLDESNLQLLVQSIAYIFKQASKVILKPTVLQKQLSDNLQFNEEKAEIFVKLWLEQTKNDFGNFEDRMKLDDISWELNLQSASKFCNKESSPNARVQFNISSLAESKKDNIVLELNDEELLQFYSTLETIQAKLDNLQNRFQTLETS